MDKQTIELLYKRETGKQFHWWAANIANIESFPEIEWLIEKVMPKIQEDLNKILGKNL
ncbi:MAG TPA: hypothetical protein VK982_12040 [Bacteroidales bacterium]|nr:hypothetical protein [Bacteroidales bacterium]